MKCIILFIFCVIFGNLNLAAQTVSGNLETKITLGPGAGEIPDFFYGAEEYANLRLKIPAGEYASVFSAFNLIAAAGSSARIMAVSGTGFTGVYSFGENYAAVLELERLYVQFSTDSLGLSTGLLRIPFGYSLAWKPMDFLNPQNPLEPDARLRGVLGIVFSFFPEKYHDMKFLVFAAAPQDPFDLGGRGMRAGLSWDNHWQKASIQLLYCFESPASYKMYDPSGLSLIAQDEYPFGLHRIGLSLKADLELGLTAECFYIVNPDKNPGINDLSASAGVDYSFFGGKLYILAEYLFSGLESVSAQSASLPAGHTGSHYLYAAGIWNWSDFSSITVACAANLEDLSFTPIVFWQYEFIQGMTVSFRVHVPLDRGSFNAGDPGEFGPQKSGNYACFIAGLKIKF